MGDLTRNFSRCEFACKCPCKRDHISMGLVLGLQEVRDDYMKPMVINSGVRCEAHNERVKGYFNSEHIDGEAVDIGCSNSMDRFTLVKLLLSHGFRRIGIHENFIHAGIGWNKTQDVIWVY